MSYFAFPDPDFARMHVRWVHYRSHCAESLRVTPSIAVVGGPARRLRAAAREIARLDIDFAAASRHFQGIARDIGTHSAAFSSLYTVIPWPIRSLLRFDRVFTIDGRVIATVAAYLVVPARSFIQPARFFVSLAHDFARAAPPFATSR